MENPKLAEKENFKRKTLQKKDKLFKIDQHFVQFYTICIEFVSLSSRFLFLPFLITEHNPNSCIKKAM